VSNVTQPKHGGAYVGETKVCDEIECASTHGWWHQQARPVAPGEVWECNIFRARWHSLFSSRRSSPRWLQFIGVIPLRSRQKDLAPGSTSTTTNLLARHTVRAGAAGSVFLRRPCCGSWHVLDFVPMTLTQLRYFLALREAKSFTLAARRCMVSQPSLTNAIRALEGELGGALFQRKPRIELTALGLAVWPHFRSIVDAVDQTPHVIAANLNGLRRAERVECSQQTATGDGDGSLVDGNRSLAFNQFRPPENL
jgi:Bacterial regulatory helix-turn-helix protein, lysR family